MRAANWMTHLGYDIESPVWRHWVRDLSLRHTFIRYDERGCGLSDWSATDFSFDDWVSDLESVVEALGLDRFPLLGVSQGGAVAVAYAARHPDRVSKLVLCSAYARGRAARAVSEEEKRAAALDLELARVGWGRDDPAFRQVFAAQFLPDGTRADWAAFDQLQRRTTSPENAVRFLEEFGRIDVRDEAGQVSCPTLIMHSRDDHRQPLRCGEELAALIPGFPPGRTRQQQPPADRHRTRMAGVPRRAGGVPGGLIDGCPRPSPRISTESPYILHVRPRAAIHAGHMKKYIRILLLGVIALLALGTLSACSSGTSTEATKASETSASDRPRHRRTVPAVGEVHRRHEGRRRQDDDHRHRRRRRPRSPHTPATAPTTKPGSSVIRRTGRSTSRRGSKTPSRPSSTARTSSAT